MALNFVAMNGSLQIAFFDGTSFVIDLITWLLRGLEMYSNASNVV